MEEHFKTEGGIPFVQSQPAPEPVESEAQTTFAAYIAHYPIEPFVVVAVEQSFKLRIPHTPHYYIGKVDGVIRYVEPPFDGSLAVFEHKTESRSSYKNIPQAWAARSQVSLYMWAIEQLYQERPAHILLDVLRRASPKGQEPPTFRRDILERTEAQSEEALADIAYVADQIEALEKSGQKRWPWSTDHCMEGNWACDYYDLHVYGDSPELIAIKYKPAKEYLECTESQLQSQPKPTSQ